MQLSLKSCSLVAASPTAGTWQLTAPAQHMAGHPRYQLHPNTSRSHIQIKRWKLRGLSDLVLRNGNLGQIWNKLCRPHCNQQGHCHQILAGLVCAKNKKIEKTFTVTVVTVFLQCLTSSYNAQCLNDKKLFSNKGMRSFHTSQLKQTIPAYTCNTWK